MLYESTSYSGVDLASFKHCQHLTNLHSDVQLANAANEKSDHGTAWWMKLSETQIDFDASLRAPARCDQSRYSLITVCKYHITHAFTRWHWVPKMLHNGICWSIRESNNTGPCLLRSRRVSLIESWFNQAWFAALGFQTRHGRKSLLCDTETIAWSCSVSPGSGISGRSC